MAEMEMEDQEKREDQGITQEPDAAGIALTVIFGAVIPIALAVALIVVGVKLSDAKKKLKQTQKSDE